ncbi:MAG TPA: helicase HerA-like domain-containing protein [Gemmatimonadales bacterium]|jgi:DNA helicase HerA-like ATPase
MSSLQETLSGGYAFAAPVVTLGAALDGTGTVTDPKVAFPTAMMNRHGLIAGATGTGKTRTLQLMAEQLSAQGVPVFVADIKGDLSGLAVPGARSPKVEERATAVGIPWEPRGHPTEFVSLTGKTGAQLRATVSSFGPLLLGKVLDLNDTQTSVLTLVFKICDDQGLPLLDFADLRAVLRYLSSDEGKPVLSATGGMSSATVGVLLRQMVELEQQGADQFFGEPEFDIRDLLEVTRDGRGVITALELSDAQDRPALFSTFMMWLLAELHEVLPEAGDLPKPKLVFFFDEAHLLFRDASKAFLSHVEQVVRLVRSKGVGIFFVTQTPKDLPDEILAQLGSRVQHALRAHTPDDEKNLRATVRTYPKTQLYDLQETLTSLGIGEAIVTGLNPRGVPTPVIATMLAPPTSRMAPLTAEEFQQEFAESDLMREYGTPVDRESAEEMLAARLAQSASAPADPKPNRSRSAGRGGLVGALTGTMARTIGRELVRGVFGMLRGKAPRRTTRSRW